MNKQTRRLATLGRILEGLNATLEHLGTDFQTGVTSTIQIVEVTHAIQDVAREISANINGEA